MLTSCPGPWAVGHVIDRGGRDRALSSSLSRAVTHRKAYQSFVRDRVGSCDEDNLEANAESGTESDWMSLAMVVERNKTSVKRQSRVE